MSATNATTANATEVTVKERAEILAATEVRQQHVCGVWGFGIGVLELMWTVRRVEEFRKERERVVWSCA